MTPLHDFLPVLRDSLKVIQNARYYESERAFQGALLAELSQRLPQLQWDGAIVEQEYQKRMLEHGIKIRPDIIIHVPYKAGQEGDRRENNFVVIELKLKPTEVEALADYMKLSQMCEILNYPLGIFIAIGGQQSFFEKFEGPSKDRLCGITVNIHNNQVVLGEEQGSTRN